MTAAAAEAYPCGPALDESDLPYWQGLRDGRLLLPRCARCGRWRSLGTVLCTSCWSFETSWEDVAMTGRVHSWIRTHRDFMSEIDVHAPYVTTLVSVDDAPVRVLGLIPQAPEVVRIGDRVTGRVEQPANAAWPLLRWDVAS